MSAVFESIAPPKWDYESIVPVAPLSGEGQLLWAHGLNAAPSEIIAFLKAKPSTELSRYVHGYREGWIIPLEMNRDGDEGRSHSFYATGSGIFLNQGASLKITGLSRHFGAEIRRTLITVGHSYFDIFVKARL